MIRGRHFLAVGAGVLAAASQALFVEPTRAQGDTRNIQVTANVKGGCRFESTPNINFGDLDPAAATDRTQAVTVSFRCTKGVNYTLTVGNGLNYEGGKNRMKRTLGLEYIPYDITPRSQTVNGKGFSTTDTIKLEGSVLAADYQNVTYGAYADTVTLSIQP